jgi:hypothetical protein
MEPMSLALSIVALVVSILTFALNFRAGRLAERRGRMPVLVFEWQSNGWVLNNVGSGPALNVIVAQGKGDPPRKGILLQRGVHEPWFNPVQLPPLARDAQYPLSWIAEESGLGATYADALGATYTAKCGNDRSITFDGVHIPVWQDGVRPHWQLAGTQPSERWAEMRS